MTELEKTIRTYRLLLFATWIFCSMAFGMAVQSIIDNSSDGAGGIPAIAALICAVIAHHYLKIIEGMELLEDLTWESERV